MISRVVSIKPDLGLFVTSISGESYYDNARRGMGDINNLIVTVVNCCDAGSHSGTRSH